MTRRHAGRLVALAIATLWAAGCIGDPPTVKALLRQVESASDPAQKSAAIERFLAAHGGNPIIEQNSRLFFFVGDDGSGRTPRIVGDFNSWAMTAQGYDAKAGTPARIAGTSWSLLEGTAFTNARLEYTFLFDQDATTDPRNPRTVRTFTGPRSEIRMPFFVSHPEIDGPAPASVGRLTEEAFPSRLLKATRRVWTYVPAGYDRSQDIYPTVYFLDGGNYAEWMAVPSVLDRLIAAGRIPPLIAVFVEPGTRQEEYSRNPLWRAFVATELVPAIDQRLRTFPAPDQRAIFGSSLGGYGALDLAVEHPGVFGLCASLAPPAQAATLITNQAQGQRAVFGVRFFELGATYDTDVTGARTLRTALEEARADVVYEEVPEGHAAETFRTHIGHALRVLLPAAPAS
ncbi:MAG: alpha/beta hydrolase-fold protein [Acidobacteriota bacterium]